MRRKLNIQTPEDVVVISVSEAALLFGLWRDQQEEYRGKRIVVVNRKNHRAVGAFQLIDVPIAVKQVCKCCGGRGEVEVKIQ